LRTDFAVMYACGLRAYQAEKTQAHFVLPETLCEFRGRMDEGLIDALIAIQAAAAMEEGLGSPAHLVIDTFPCEQGSQRVTDATTLYSAKTLELIDRITQRCGSQATKLTSQAQSLQGAQKSCVALRNVEERSIFVKLVRQTEQHLRARRAHSALGSKPSTAARRRQR
jgi:hypothetical protein